MTSMMRKYVGKNDVFASPEVATSSEPANSFHVYLSFSFDKNPLLRLISTLGRESDCFEALDNGVKLGGFELFGRSNPRLLRFAVWCRRGDGVIREG